MLKEISIDELEPGMYVQKIVQQNGNLIIKSQGKVTSKNIVRTLKKKGILRLLIDPSKQFVPAEQLAPEPSSTAEPPSIEPLPEKQSVSFEAEINYAKRLHDKGKGLQKRLLDSVAKNLPIDLKLPKEFAQHLVGSIDRNPNALMCLTKIREKDSYLLEHSLNVAVLLANFAKHIGIAELEVQELALSGFLHDIGKIKVPDEILHKPGRLNDEEMNIMRKHVDYGIETLQEMELPAHIVRTISEHHERLDGLGYPSGAKSDEISLFGRMIAIVDTYDAITAHRCYKAGMPSQRALKILLEDSPVKYDLELVQKFVKCVGVYPVGSLVELTGEQVAMVVRQHPDSPLKPVVKVFYSSRTETYTAIKDLDLNQSQYKIEKAVLPEDFGIDFNRFFEEKIALA